MWQAFGRQDARPTRDEQSTLSRLANGIFDKALHMLVGNLVNIIEENAVFRLVQHVEQQVPVRYRFDLLL